MLMHNTAAPHTRHPGGLMIFNKTNHRYYSLDAMASLVWNLIQQPHTLREICEVIMQHFDVNADECERDLLALLQQLEDEGLIEAESDAA